MTKIVYNPVAKEGLQLLNEDGAPGAGINPLGAYNAATDYAVGDSVSYNGSSYLMFNNAPAGTLPTDTSYWQVLALKGTDGTNGADGADGADGVGVVAGGTTGQVLAKKTNADYDTEWVDQSAGTIDHAGLSNLAYADSGHTGFQPAGDYLTAETDPVFTAWDKDHGDLINIGTNTHAQIDTKLASLLYDRETTKDPTGFTNNDAITVSYNSTTRKITLTGTFEAYYRGEKIAALVDGWESAAHPDTLDKLYFLYYNGTDFVFSDTPWTFDSLQIAYVQYNTNNKFAIGEVHGFMDWHSHQEFHQTIGTYRTAGGTLTAGSYALNSTTAADRRPLIDAPTIYDEDLKHVITALTTETYTQKYLSGAGAARTFVTGASDIIPVTGATPYWNQYTGGAWQQTAMNNNEYAAVWLTAIPTTADAGSQAYRYIWTQPQSVGTLAQIQALTTNDLNIGDPALLASEFVFMAKVIILMTGNDWQLISVTNLTGNRYNQTGSPAGTYLSTVAHDTTLTGSGTSGDPLKVANPSSGTNTGDVTVLDSDEIDFTLSGQQLTAVIKSGSIDETKLDTSVNASLDLADSAIQTELDPVFSASEAANFASGDASKLAGIEAGAEVNVQADWNQATNTADDYIKNKPSIPTQYTDEMAQDAVGNAVGNGLDYDDATGAIAVDETELAHNSLGSKQGGTTDEYYHLTAAQATVVSNTSGTNTGDQVLPTRDSLGLDTDDTVTFANLSGTNTGDQDLSGLVPYTGATTNVDLGNNTLDAYGINSGAGLSLFNTTGLNYYSDAGVTSIGSIDMTQAGYVSFGSSGYGTATHQYTALTEGRTYDYPNADGTVALTSDLPVVPYVGTDAPANPDNGDLWFDTDDTTGITSGNSETVDGFHASSTPTANTIPVLDSGAIMPAETVANSSLNTTAGDLGGAWKDWTPTLTNLSGGTLTLAKYCQIGKTIYYKFSYLLGGAGVAGVVTFTLPVTATTGSSTAFAIGDAQLIDAGTAVYRGVITQENTTTAQIRANKVDGTYALFTPLSSTVPHTWGNKDIISCSGTYEAA